MAICVNPPQPQLSVQTSILTNLSAPTDPIRSTPGLGGVEEGAGGDLSPTHETDNQYRAMLQAPAAKHAC